MLAQKARQEDRQGYLLTLDYPVFNAIMSYAEDRELRREFYTAWVTRASDQGPDAGRWDNGPIMEAQADLDELTGFARDRLGLDHLEVWDLPYCAEKLKHHRFELNDELLKPYFPAPKVIQGLFDLVGRVFDIRIQPGPKVETWHPDVSFHEIRGADGTLHGHFYLDLYARKNKRGGAWMDDCAGRLRDGERLQTPIAFMTCNLSPPVDDEPALFSHDEVLTLFHEFGHGLHHLLTRIDYPAVAGISGVEWDAVELPSQFLENFAWTREGLDLISAHYQTGEVLPQAMFESLLESRHFHAGLQMLRQIEFALFDLRLHRDYDPQRGGRIQQTLDAVRAEVAVVRPPAFNRFQHSFSHIFAGGYAAGYYSYKWAEVLSADAFGLFEEQGVLNPAAGARFRDVILARGGSQPARELYREFRQRDAREDALLRQCGLDQVTPT